MDLVKALISIRPNSNWELNGDDYTGLVWKDEQQIKPTKTELETEALRLKTEYESKEYQRLRAKEYPSMQEQLDMQYWDSINDTTTWQDAINAIKVKYPKPEGV